MQYTLGAVVQLVEYRSRSWEVAGSTHTRSTASQRIRGFCGDALYKLMINIDIASNLEQVANLLCAQANSASYPERDGKWVVATATGDGVSASCTVGLQPLKLATSNLVHNFGLASSLPRNNV